MIKRDLKRSEIKTNIKSVIPEENVFDLGGKVTKCSSSDTKGYSSS
jgi:hypothetical protein